VLHQIGIGTLGPVFRTYEPSRDRLVAVKAFRLDIVPEQAQALALALSRASQASLFHPSIVEPIEAGVEGTVAYRAEEYVAAESLDVAMRHYAPAPLDKVLPFITQLAGAIDFARAAGVGHGGLHPRDIFVTPDEARATGFGVVDALEQVGIRAPIRRPYSAPERIAGTTWGTPADVFSLAAITFELLTGKRPAGTGAQIGALPDAPTAAVMQGVLVRAMDDEPARRHGSALAFAAALEAASQGRILTEDDEKTARTSPVAPIVLPVSEPAAATAAEKSGIEALRDPEHEALDDLLIAPDPDVAAPPPAAEPVREPTPVPLFGAEAEAEADPHRDRFVDDFVEEEAAVAELRGLPETKPAPAAAPSLHDDAPLETPVPHAVVAASPMFRSVAGEPDLQDPSEHTRPAILPYALVAVPMLLVGFAGGYFVGSRDRIAAPADTAQYSDQKVTPSSVPTAPAPTVASAPPASSPATASPIAPGESAPAKGAPGGAAAVTPPPSRPAPEPHAAAVGKGQIVVRSLPTHAGVSVNGTWRGRTPLTIDDVGFGSYVVRVVLPGYQVAKDEFTLNARTPSRTFMPRLEHVPATVAPAPAPPPGRETTPAAKAAPTKAAPAKAAPAKAAAAEPAPASYNGSLYVDSRPRGATVFLDGKSVGQTPVSVPDVQVGSHVVRIEMDGKRPVTANPRIAAGKTERVTVSLEDK
jgi:serine/threonine-protein kinase